MGVYFSKPAGCLVTCILLSLPGAAETVPPVAFDDNSQRLMAVDFDDGTPISDAMIAYELTQVWYLPLGEFTQGLSLAIQVSPALGTAEGYVLQELRRFHLDVGKCQAEFNSQTETFECGLAIVSDDDIFIAASLLERWFPLKIQINPFASKIVVQAKEKFPKQQRRERERQAQTFSSLTGAYDPGYPRVPVPRQRWDDPVVDQQLTFRHQELNRNAQNLFRHDTLIAGETFGMEANGYIGGSADSVDQTRVSLARREADGGLLGPLNAREVQLLDFTLPTLPLIGGGSLGRGALISSYPLRQPSNFSFRDFRGDLPAGWEVELYHNDVLIGRQVSIGLYEFTQVPLLYGLNRFRLAFYGPQGQRRESFETFNITSALLQPKTRDYRVALANVAPTTTSVAHNRAIVQFDQSLNESLTLRTGFAHLTPLRDSVAQSYGYLGANGYCGRALLSASTALGERGGYATEAGVQVPLNMSTIGAKYTHLSKFKSDLFRSEGGLVLEDMITASGAFNLLSSPATRTTFELARKFYETGEDGTALTQRLSVNTGPVHWFNTITAETGSANLFAGQLAALTVLTRTELRMTTDYEKEVKSVGLATQTRLSDRLSIGAGAQHGLIGKLTEYQLTLNRHFSRLTLSADATASSRGDFSIGALLSYSLMFDPARGSLRVSGRAQSSYGAASVYAYFDRNQNGVADPDEPPITGVEIQVNLQETGFFTDETGRVLVPQLPVHQPVDLSISLKSLEDPVHKPLPRGVRIVPRPGKTVLVELPVVALSDIDGMVRVIATGRTAGKRGIEVQLLDHENNIIQRVKTEPDGFFLIEGVKTGEYRIRLDPEQLRAAGLISKPEFHSLTVAPEGFSGSAMDFILFP